MGELHKPRRIRRAAGIAAVMAVSSSLFAQALAAGGLLSPIVGTGGAVSPFRAPSGEYAAFATGTVVHAGVGGAAGVGLDLVSSTAAATSAANRTPVNSETGRVALPTLPAKGSYGQGLGLGAKLGLLPGVSTNLFGHAVATAPPSTAPVEQEAASIKVAPVAAASPLRGRAQALSSAMGCVLGSNLAYGQGNAVDISFAALPALQGLSLGKTTTGQPVSRSESRAVVVPGSGDGRLGLMAETTQLLGPVTLLAGTAKVTTVEVKGEWALRVTADGKTGAVSYSPQGVTNDQAVVLVRNAAGAVVASATASQMRLAGAVGLRLDVPGVGEIVVGEQPRARGKGAGAPQVSGTSVEAAVDLVRIRILGQDVRIGHMEAAVAVPPAGLTCPGPDVTMTPDTATVAAGSDFGVKVRVRNPNEGALSGLTVAAHMAADPGVGVDAGPSSRENLVAPNGAAFKLSSPLGSGQSVELPARVHVRPGSGPGRIRLSASASGRYGDGPLAVPTGGNVSIDGPMVTATAPAPAGEPKISVGQKGTATAGAPTASGGRKPPRTSAGITGAAGTAASAAPVVPAPTPAPTMTPAPPVEAPAAEPTPPPTVEPGTVPAPPTTTPEEAAAGRLPGENVDDRRHYGWAAAAAIFLMVVAGAGATRLLGGARR
jgi:hypothetical protein